MMKRIGLGILITWGASTVSAGLLIAPELAITQDQFNTEQKLNLTIYNPKVYLDYQQRLSTPLGFFIYTNYPNQIKDYSLTIFYADDLDNLYPLQTFQFSQISPYEALLWDGSLLSGTLDSDTKYKAILSVTDQEGRIDRVNPVYFDTLGVTRNTRPTDFIEMRQAENSDNTGLNNYTFGRLKESVEIPGFGLDNKEFANIQSSALQRKIVVKMEGLKGKTEVMLNNEPIVVDHDGYAIRELILDSGEYTFALSWVDETGQRRQRAETIEINPANEFFFVGLSSITYGQNHVSGNGKRILTEADEDFYSGSGNWEGQLQFYLKGNIDQYRVTAHVDTTEMALDKAFGRIGDRDPRRFRRELNTNDYYPIFGDDSTVENDVDTQGKFYAKLERGKSYLLWGNYNTQMTGTSLSDFNRSLYGAKAYYESEELTTFDDTKRYVTLFGATGDTRGSHNEFLSTGGSLYFLKHQRVTTGSLKLAVEIRDVNTGRVKSTSTLTEGVDYEINSFQGRIILTSPLPMTASDNSGSTIISGGGLVNGDKVWLVADYEYYSDGFDMQEQRIYGGRAYNWFGDHVRIGASYANEEQANSESYQLYGFDVTIRPTLGTYSRLEYASSRAGSNDIYVSANGGLGFNKVSIGKDTKGSAWRFDQVVKFDELVDAAFPLTASAYYSLKQQGFSSFSTARERDLTEWGAELRYDLADRESGFVTSYSSEVEENQNDKKILRLQYFTEIVDNLKTVFELQNRREKQINQDNTTETLAAIKLETKLFDDRDKAYVMQQATLDRSGDVASDNRTTIGYESQVTENIQLGAELFTGNRGSGGGVLANWQVSDNAKLYTKLINDVDSNANRSLKTSVGTSYQPTSLVELYSERQFEQQTKQRSTSDIYGVKYSPTESQFVELSVSSGRVDYRDTNGAANNDTRRNVYVFGYGFKDEGFQLNNNVEYRWEKGQNDVLKQWVSTNRAKTVLSEDLSWLAQFDIAKTTGSADDIVNNFTEAAVGFAYRPQFSNHLNLFGKATYIQGVDPADQIIANSNNNATSYYSNDYEQKSWVFALEGVYEYNRHLEMAFKAAHRRGELRYRNESEWFSSGASLYATRLNVNYADFEYQVEFRTLRTTVANDHKDGVVTSVYRYLGDSAKIGIGYNFTDYNDDLTRLNYQSHGWFVNVVGAW